MPGIAGTFAMSILKEQKFRQGNPFNNNEF